MLCSRCGYDNLDDARYCAICGNASTEPVKTPGEVRVDAGTLPCPSCGFLNEEMAAYCRSCGKKMKKRTSRKVSKKPVPSMPPPEIEEESPLSLEPSVQEAELAVLFGLDASNTGGTASTAEVEVAAEPRPDAETAQIAEIEAEAAPTFDDEPKLETIPPPDDDRPITNPEEMARLAALIESEAPAPSGEAIAELPPAGPVEPAAEEVPEMPISESETPTPSEEAVAELPSAEPIEPAAETAEKVPETPIPEPEAPASSQGGGMIPDEMARLIASIKSDKPEEPALLEPAERVAEPLETADEMPESEVPTDADAFSAYVSTPHESVEAVLVDEVEDEAEETASGDDNAEAASIAAMAEVTSTLNSLIKDLLNVEIEEGGEADIVDMPSSVFPPPDPGQYTQPVSEAAKEPRLSSVPKLPIGLWFRDAVGYFVLVAAFLLSGLSIGLWVWYLFVS